MPSGFSLAVPDWEDRIRAGKSLVPAININPAEQRRAIKMFERLRLPDVPDRPPLAEACGDWFKEIVGPLLGSLDPQTGARLVRGLFLLAPKKSSKTTYGAAMMTTALLMNRRPNGEFLLTGPTHDISELAYAAADGMIEADDEWQRQENGQEGYLKKTLHTRDHLKTIEHRLSGASLKIKTFDMDVATGVKPVGVLVDELHIIAKDKNAARVLGQLRGGRISNHEAFFAIITTQSDEPPVGVMLTELKKARDIRDGVVDGDTLSVLYEFPKDIVDQRLGEIPKWYDSKYWPMVTPNLNRSVTISVLEKEFEEAKQSGEAEIRRWASQHLNVEIGLALRSDRWSGADYWESCGDKTVTLESILARSEVVTIGIDGGGMDDLLAIAVLGRDRVTRKWLLWTHAWAHQSVLERRKSEASRFRDFENAHELTIIDDIGQDVDDIADIVLDVLNAGLLPQENAIGVDPIGVGQIIDELVKRGISEKQIIGVTQGFKMSGHVKTTERALAGAELVHGNQAIMAYAVSNARVEPKGNAFVITKQASGTAKIDPLMAAFDAVALMSKNPGAGSVYEEHGLLFV
jgi:phage terminase large subunit-like protein